MMEMGFYWWINWPAKPIKCKLLKPMNSKRLKNFLSIRIVLGEKEIKFSKNKEMKFKYCKKDAL